MHDARLDEIAPESNARRVIETISMRRRQPRECIARSLRARIIG